jgi:hypothetical protein
MSVAKARTQRKNKAYSHVTAKLHEKLCTDAKPLQDKDYSHVTVNFIDTA